MESITGTLTEVFSLTGRLSGSGLVAGTVQIPEHIGTAYTGAYSVTPGDEPVVLETDGTYLSGNIVVNPVPSNYGLITWNGAGIRVS